MIHIFFVPGMFGTTLEYVLRSFTEEYEPIECGLTPDGSMHFISKEAHMWTDKQLVNFFTATSKLNSITTLCYPTANKNLSEFFSIFSRYTKLNDKTILIHADNTDSAELNMLFQFHKISKGVLNQGIDIFCGKNENNILQWNSSYSHWSQMQCWELREWLSIFYPVWINEWIESKNIVIGENILHVSNRDILFNTDETLPKIIGHCNLTVNRDLTEFVDIWQQAQKYIIDEFNLCTTIVDNIHNNITWDSSKISIISEAIIQQRLRQLGYEIKCYGLNTFPNSTKQLYSLLEKV